MAKWLSGFSLLLDSFIPEVKFVGPVHACFTISADKAPTLSYDVCDGLLTGLFGLPTIACLARWPAVEAPEARSRQVPPAWCHRRAVGAEALGTRPRGGGSRRNGVTAERGS